MSRERSVSPVGTSKFEKAYAPPSHSIRSVASATSPTASSIAFDERRNGFHYSKPSQASTGNNSVASADNNAYSTAPTSLENSPTENTVQGLPKHSKTAGLPAMIRRQTHSSHSAEHSVNVVDPDEWFARFRNDSADQHEHISDECPDRATLAAAYNIPIFSADGTSMPFGRLYHQATAQHTRQLIIFIRHFYCGACQAYLKAISDNITMQEYFSIPTPTSIVVIGCGHPELIPFYKLKTGCPFPIYAEPTRALFKRLGMVLSVNIGMKRPEYMKDISPVAWAAGQLATIRRGVKARQAELNKTKMEAAERKKRQAALDSDMAQLDAMEEQQTTDAMNAASLHGDDKLAIRKRDVVKGGNIFQIGGEFLFEEGEVVWCHRMKNYRNHAEVSVIRRMLELDD
jgi:hypothetical protein